jgi:hypothetical protein
VVVAINNGSSQRQIILSLQAGTAASFVKTGRRARINSRMN